MDFLLFILIGAGSIATCVSFGLGFIFLHQIYGQLKMQTEGAEKIAACSQAMMQAVIDFRDLTAKDHSLFAETFKETHMALVTLRNDMVQQQRMRETYRRERDEYRQSQTAREEAEKNYQYGQQNHWANG